MTARLRTKDFLGHILEAIDRIESYTVGLTFSDFKDDCKTQDAVIRNLKIVGEACSNIRKHAPEFSGAHPEVPWLAPLATAMPCHMVTSRLIWRWSGPRCNRICQVSNKQ